MVSIDPDKKIKVDIISPDLKTITTYYYDIEAECKKIVESYISISKENKIRFEQYAANHTYFKPYLDFVIFELHYYVDKLDPIIALTNDTMPVMDYSFNNIMGVDCWIDPEGKCLCLVNEYGFPFRFHNQLAKQILNNLIIREPNVYAEDLLSNKITDFWEVLMNLGYIRFARIDDGNATIHFNSNHITNRQKEIIEELKIYGILTENLIYNTAFVENMMR